MEHEELVEIAEEAINKVFGDTSVGQQTTRDSMLVLEELITSLLEVLGD